MMLRGNKEICFITVFMCSTNEHPNFILTVVTLWQCSSNLSREGSDILSEELSVFLSISFSILEHNGIIRRSGLINLHNGGYLAGVLKVRVKPRIFPCLNLGLNSCKSVRSSCSCIR